MIDLADEDETPKTGTHKRWRSITLTTIQVVPPIISIGCAVMAGYFTYLTALTANKTPPADVATLAVSIMKSGNTSPEMRDWAADVLGIQTDIRMPAKSIRQ
ncbi:MAG: hypothetical protein ABJB10_08740 [Mesorhizobium sp.]